MRRGKYGDASAARGGRERAVANLGWYSLRVEAGRHDVLYFSGRVVVGDRRRHVAAHLPVCPRPHLPTGVVVVRDVVFVRRDDGFLLDESAAGEERVGDRPLEHTHAQAVEEQLHAIADRAYGRRAKTEDALAVTRAIGVARRVVEERVPPARSDPGLALIEWARVLDHDLLARCDRSDQWPARIEREGGVPVPPRLVRPGDSDLVVGFADRRRAR